MYLGVDFGFESLQLLGKSPSATCILQNFTQFSRDSWSLSLFVYLVIIIIIIFFKAQKILDFPIKQFCFTVALSEYRIESATLFVTPCIVLAAAPANQTLGTCSQHNGDRLNKGTRSIPQQTRFYLCCTKPAGLKINRAFSRVDLNKPKCEICKLPHISPNYRITEIYVSRVKLIDIQVPP